jgi:molecular chaperone GrpE
MAETDNENAQETEPAPARDAQGEAGADGTNARIAELESQLAEARADASANWEKYLRERAEMENFRKRTERTSQDRVRRDKRELLHKVLEVMDNLDRAMRFEESMDRESLHQGLRMVQWQLTELLKGEGLTPVPTVGETFDPYVHEAIEQVVTKDHPEGTVVEEVRKGYMLGDEMLRPARVKVAASHEE